MYAKRIISLLFFLVILFTVIHSIYPVHAATDAVLDYTVDQDFNGTSDYVDQTGDLSNVKQLEQGSILVKFKSTSSKAVNTFLSASHTEDASSNLSFTMNNGTIYVENREDRVYATQLQASGSYNDGEWHTAVLTVGIDGTKIYVDGNQLGASDSIAFFSNISDLDGMWIGKNVDNAGDQWYYKGQLEKVQLYDKALTAEEVKALSGTDNNGFFKEKELFNVNDGKGYGQYRIPSISVMANGTVLAVAEARTGGDQTPTDLVLRRSTDGGETFSDQVILAPGVENGNAEMNPMLLAEDKGSTVHLLWSRWEWDNPQYFIRTSKDNGATWGKAREITSVLDAYTNPDSPDYFKNISGAGMGPGHAFQMSNGALVVPIYLTTYGWANSTVAYIYSEDGGETWKAGPKVPNPPGFSKIHENMMVEISNGGLMANMRNPGSDYRAVSTTTGLEEPWTTPVSDKTLIGPINAASLALYDADTILFTNTANKSTRTNMTIRMSDDDGKTWYESREIYAGQTGYSDVDVGPDKTIYTFYEKPAGSKITLARFNKDWIEGSANIRLKVDEQVKPGVSTTVKTAFTNYSEKVENDVAINMHVPENWTAEANQSAAFDAIEPGESVEVTWNITPDKNTLAGNYELRVDASYEIGGNQQTESAVKEVKILPPIPTETAYLSDLGWISAMNGWGPVERDTSVGSDSAGDGSTLTINGETFDKGLGVHAYSEVVYHLGGKFSRFTSKVGVDDEVSPASAASVVFEVWGDGGKLYDSGIMTADDDAKAIDVSIENVNELKLIVTDGGNGNGSDHANWAEAKIIRYTAPVSASLIEAHVEELENEGAFESGLIARLLGMHVDTLVQYEDKELTEKLIKHLNGFKQLLQQQKENNAISAKAYDTLTADAKRLLAKYQ
ncbi:NPCBM/NEW2 domain-containing protein [Virgibacillus salexigens]|uniref:NPCBM/NEW2 domain-containing protein n=1 Tax=Virgibacillus salexigens TaxID=61016 RepID=UPI0019093BB9|nr:NPCBM/NEW2 domain-containing protein [Virgibacillus salexigens]